MEAAIIVPMVFLMFVLILYIIFYYHDKAILEGAAYETAVVGTERKDYEEEELKAYFRKRVGRKLILFSGITSEITMEEEAVTVQCTASKKRMKVCGQITVKRTEPEKFIRDIRKMKPLGKNMGGEN